MDRQRTPQPDRAVDGQDARRPGRWGVFLLVPFLWTSTAPQERREQRSWPRRGEGQDARSQEKEPARRDAGRTYRDVGRSSRKIIEPAARNATATARQEHPHPTLSRKRERGTPSKRINPTQRTTFPSASMTLTSPSLSARTPASIFDRSPTTTQVSASGRTISLAAAWTAASVCASMRGLSV